MSYEMMMKLFNIFKKDKWNKTYSLNIILDMVDAITQEEAKKMFVFLIDYCTLLTIYDERRLYSEVIPRSSSKVLYNPEKITSCDVEIYSTPLLIGKDGCVFIQIFNKIKHKMRVGVVEYEKNRIWIKRKIKKREIMIV